MDLHPWVRHVSLITSLTTVDWNSLPTQGPRLACVLLPSMGRSLRRMSSNLARSRGDWSASSRSTIPSTLSMTVACRVCKDSILCEVQLYPSGSSPGCEVQLYPSGSSPGCEVQLYPSGSSPGCEVQLCPSGSSPGNHLLGLPAVSVVLRGSPFSKSPLLVGAWSAGSLVTPMP